MTDPEYRKASGISHSALRAFVGREPKGNKRTLVKGTAFHKMVLRPNDAAEFGILETDPKLNTAQGKAEMAEFEAETGLPGLKASEFWELKKLHSGLLHNKDVVRIIEATGSVEVCMFAEIVPGVLSKGMADKITRGAIFDLKTTYAANEEEFMTSLAKFGYVNQAAHYQSLYMAITGEWLPFVWICCSTKTYECFIVQSTPLLYHIGRSWCEDVLAMMEKK
jgi:hypothetical protein